MIRTLFLVLAILAVAVMPNPAHGRGGGHGGHGHHHGHHQVHHRFHHFSSFVFVYDPFLYYPYPYYLPYPVYSQPVVGEPPPVVYQPPAVQREVVYQNGKCVLYGDGVNQPYEGLDPGSRTSLSIETTRTRLGITLRRLR